MYRTPASHMASITINVLTCGRYRLTMCMLCCSTPVTRTPQYPFFYDAGHFVQKEIGKLKTSLLLLLGNYVVEFGLGNPTYPIPLTKASLYTQSELEAGPACPRPSLQLTDVGSAKGGRLYLSRLGH
jgi:hypothetical protein